MFLPVDKQRDSSSDRDGSMSHKSVSHPRIDRKPLPPPPVHPRQSSRHQLQSCQDKAVSLADLAQSQSHVKSEIKRDVNPRPQICRTNTQDGLQTNEMVAPDVSSLNYQSLTGIPPIHYPADQCQ